jgi:hypothetical protein
LAIKSYIKQQYYRNTELIRLSCEVDMFKRYVSLKRDVSRRGLQPCNLQTVNEMRHFYQKQTYRVCHIIGSGGSALESVKLIDTDVDFVIGFNFAALLPIRFNVYLIEVATSFGNRALASELQRDFLISREVLTTSDVYIKGLSSRDSWDVDFIKKSYGGSIKSVIDIVPDLPILGLTKNVNQAAESVFAAERSKFCVCSTTSTITATLLAYQLGFRHIVVHGMDFTGPHFFHNKHMNTIQGVQELRSLNPAITNANSLGHGHWLCRREWPLAIRSLNRQGISVFSSIQSSRFSTFAPTYFFT